MVAFELAKVHEQGQRGAEALDWYRKAYEHFRRDEWRTKAAEAIQRLGGTPPAAAETPAGEGSTPEEPAAPAAKVVPTPREWASLPDRLFHETGTPPRRAAGSEPAAESGEEMTEDAGRQPGNVAPGYVPPGQASPPTPAGEGRQGGKRRRRGRRGGRRHRRDGRPPEGQGTGEGPQLGHVKQRTEERAAPPPGRPPAPPPRAESAEESGWLGSRAEELRTRSGDPGLASRVARLEMQVRRLLACPPHKVSESEDAPAGPGVLILSDADLTTHYYICACDTLRIEVGRLTRSERGGRGRGRDERSSLRSRLAEHLEISESQVVKYLESHCVVRWLQLDEGAAKVAHFAIAALEPILSE